MKESVYKFLTKPKKLDQQIKKKRLELQKQMELISSAGAIRYDKDKIQISNQDSPLDRYIVRREALESDITRLTEEMHEAIAAIGAATDKLENETGALIITMRYVNRIEFSDIAVMIEKSERQMFRIYHEALENLSNVIECQ